MGSGGRTPSDSRTPSTPCRTAGRLPSGCCCPARSVRASSSPSTRASEIAVPMSSLLISTGVAPSALITAAEVCEGRMRMRAPRKSASEASGRRIPIGCRRYSGIRPSPVTPCSESERSIDAPDRARENSVEQVLAVDEEWRLDRSEARVAGKVPGAGTDDADVVTTGPDHGDRLRLDPRGRFAGRLEHDLHPERSAGQLRHLGSEVLDRNHARLI